MSSDQNLYERVNSKTERLKIILRDPNLRLQEGPQGWLLVSDGQKILPPQEPGLSLPALSLALSSLLTDFDYCRVRADWENDHTGHWLRVLDQAMDVLLRFILFRALGPSA
jgi:hypothetical protein